MCQPLIHALLGWGIHPRGVIVTDRPPLSVLDIVQYCSIHEPAYSKLRTDKIDTDGLPLLTRTRHLYWSCMDDSNGPMKNHLNLICIGDRFDLFFFYSEFFILFPTKTQTYPKQPSNTEMQNTNLNKNKFLFRRVYTGRTNCSPPKKKKMLPKEQI